MSHRSPADVSPADSRLVLAFRRLQRKLERLATRLCDARDDVDEAARAVEAIVGDLSAASRSAASGMHRSGERAGRADEHVLRAEAAAGVASLVVERHADGTGTVSVNGRRPFRLPPKLTALLLVLLAAAGPTDDGLLGWSSRAELATALNKMTGGSTSPAAVPKLVYKLRESFHDENENWFLIQRNRRLGVRVALRR